MVHSFSKLGNTIAHTRMVRAELVSLQNYTYCSGALMLKSFWQLSQYSNWTAWAQKDCFFLKENSCENYKNGISGNNVTYSQAFEMSDFWAPIYLTYIIGLQTVSKSYLAIFHNKYMFLSAILAHNDCTDLFILHLWACTFGGGGLPK